MMTRMYYVLQTVRLQLDKPPLAPYCMFVEGDGWRFDCGNVVGWSFDIPKRCCCGHCLPGYEPLRLAQWFQVRRLRRAAQQRHRRWWARLARQEAKP